MKSEVERGKDEGKVEKNCQERERERGKAMRV